MKTCSVEGCPNPARGRSWCQLHYQHWYRNGDPHLVKRALNGDGFIHMGYKAHRIAPDFKMVFDHVRIAEKAFGRKLPPQVHVHHADGNRLNNTNSNLVICPNASYHKLLHMRMRAMKSCGNPDWRSCRICKKFDSPDRMDLHHRHPTCINDYNRRRLSTSFST